MQPSNQPTKPTFLFIIRSFPTASALSLYSMVCNFQTWVSRYVLVLVSVSESGPGAIANVSIITSISVNVSIGVRVLGQCPCQCHALSRRTNRELAVVRVRIDVENVSLLARSHGLGEWQLCYRS